MITEQTDSHAVGRNTVNEVIDALARSDFLAAFERADAAIRGGALEPALFNARAIWFQQKGRYAEALADFECARASFPRDPALLNSIGLCLFRLGQFQRAIMVLDQAIAFAPGFADSHYFRALALESIEEIEAAQRALERTVTLQPDHLEAITGLAIIMIKKGLMPEAAAFARRALELDPEFPDASVVLARIESENEDHVAVERRLRANLDNPGLKGENRFATLGLLGDALDRQGSAAEAFATYETANEERRALHAPDHVVGGALNNVLGLVRYFERTNAWAPSRVAAAGKPGAAGHVFLLGFMRSGTTLLESILASSPQIVAVDECDFLRDATQPFLGSDDGLDRLAVLKEEELVRRGNEYWRAVYHKTGSVVGKVFLDKMPFNSVRLPLIARFFPEARILFAIRDPRDVVLSAFRNRFVIHADSFEFLRLEDCARYYAAVMCFAELCFQKLPLTHFQHRYEDMIENFDESVKAVCEFISIDWNESMRDFTQGVGTINIGSVSAPQVRRGLYRGAAGQWRRYRKQLQPVLPILQPWIERLGYPPD